MPAKQSRMLSPAVACNADDHPLKNIDDEMPPTSTTEHSYAIQQCSSEGGNTGVGNGLITVGDTDEIDVVNETSTHTSQHLVARWQNSQNYHPATDHDYVAFSQFSAVVQSDIISRIEAVPTLRMTRKKKIKPVIPLETDFSPGTIKASCEDTETDTMYGLRVDNETSAALGWKAVDKKKKQSKKADNGTSNIGTSSSDKNFVKIQGAYQDDFVYFAPKISGSRARTRSRTEAAQPTNQQPNVLDWYRDLANTDKNARFGGAPSEEEVVDMVASMQEEQAIQSEDLDKMAENLTSMLCSLNNEELEKELERIGLPSKTTNLEEEAPQLTTVTMYYNDVPGLMLAGEQYVRLVDIHKQMLPSKDTGILKKRAQLLSLPLLNCSDMQRNFLQRYANAARSKSTLVISKQNAVKLIAFYVEPRQRTVTDENSTTGTDSRTGSRKRRKTDENEDDFVRVVTTRNSTRSRGQLGRLFVYKMEKKDSSCVQCETCGETLTLRKFAKHVHHQHSADELLDISVPLKIVLANGQPTSGELVKWKIFEEKSKELESKTPPSPLPPSSSPPSSPRQSARNRKRKQLHPVESYVFTPTKRSPPKRARSSQRTA